MLKRKNAKRSVVVTKASFVVISFGKMTNRCEQQKDARNEEREEKKTDTKDVRGNQRMFLSNSYFADILKNCAANKF